MTRGTAYRPVFKNAAYIFFIKLFPALSFFAVTILFSRRLPTADYGHYQHFWIMLLLLGTVAYAGLPVTLVTYTPAVIRFIAARFQAKHYGLYAGWLIFWVIVFICLLHRDLRLSGALAGALLVMYVAHAIQESLIMASKKMRGLLLANVAYAAYFLFIHWVSLRHYDLQQLLFLLLAGMLLRAAVLAIIIRVLYGKVSAIPLPETDLGKVRNLWLHLGFYDLLQNIARWADKFIIALLLPAGLYAVYFNGSQDIPFLPYLTGAVSSAVLVQLAGRKQGEEGQSHRLMYESGKLVSCIMFAIFFFLLFFSRELFLVLFSAKYLPSVPVFAVSVLVLPLRAYNYTTLLQHFHQGALINKGALLDLALSLLLMYPCYLLFGLPGIVLSFVLSTYVQVGYYLFHTSRIARVSVRELLPLKNWTIKLILFGSCIRLLHVALQSLRNDTMILLLGGSAAMVLSVAALLFELKRRKAD